MGTCYLLALIFMRAVSLNVLKSESNLVENRTKCCFIVDLVFITTFTIFFSLGTSNCIGKLAGIEASRFSKAISEALDINYQQSQ